MKMCKKALLDFSLFLGGIPSVALAHAHLVTQRPAADSVVTSETDRLTLIFSEGVERAFSGVIITGAGQKEISTGALIVSGEHHTHVQVPLKAKLAPGQYQVAWRVVSVDGHKTQGQYHFSIK